MCRLILILTFSRKRMHDTKWVLYLGSKITIFLNKRKPMMDLELEFKNIKRNAEHDK